MSQTEQHSGAQQPDVGQPDAGQPDTGQTTDARTEVLDRIRAAIAKNPTSPAVTRAYRTRGEHEPGSPALVDLLEDRLLDYKAGVHRTTLDQVAGTVRAALDRHVPTGRIVVPPGLPDEWTSGRDVLRDDGSTSTAELDTVAAVVTACAVAVAETGTIVLDAQPDQGRRALSLVPDVHVCVVQVSQVVQTVPEAVGRLDPRRPQTWISGPSATSDIELNRVEGVHGPRNLEVVLVLDAS